jgi:hypothetical protein
LYQPGTAARDQYIDIAVKAHQPFGRIMRSILHKSDDIGRIPAHSLPHASPQPRSVVQKLLFRAQNAYIARIKTKRRGIHRHIRSGFVYHGNNPQGHALLDDL